MNVEEIKSIIKEQREDAENLMSRAIPRDVPKEELLTNLSIPNVLAILGVRRSGKSTLSLLLLRDKNFAYIDFDDERLRNVNYPALTDVASPPHDGDFLLLPRNLLYTPSEKGMYSRGPLSTGSKGCPDPA